MSKKQSFIKRPITINKLNFTVCFCLFLWVWIIFGQTLWFDFINFDDHGYIHDNRFIRQGLTLESIQWIFTNAYMVNWHPITSLTNLIDVQLYGLNAGGHHATNVLIHAATAIALFLVLRNMTGSLWRSALVAALFAIHPLRVESVAWIAERKDVLSGLFFMLTIGAYARFSRQIDRDGWRTAKGSYWMVLVLFALGLMSKSMLVTLPCVLFLLDFWPLNRINNLTLGKIKTLILEKVPLFLLALLFCVVAMRTQAGTVESGQSIPAPLRLLNVISSYGTYVIQLFQPTNLALYYPYPTLLDLDAIVMFFLLGIIISVLIWFQRKKRPFLMVGWFWYVGMLVPVIGWIQVGQQAHADRYTYLPHIGLLLMIVWLIPSRWMERVISRWIVITITISILLTLTILSYQQTSLWKNSQTIWEHTLGCTEKNQIACINLAQAFEVQGQLDRSIELTEQAISYGSAPLYYSNLGIFYLKKGMPDDALKQFEKALEIDPNFVEALCGKGSVFLNQHKIEEAFACYDQAMEASPNNPKIPSMIGFGLMNLEKIDEAIPYCEKAAQLQPDNAEAQVLIGNLYASLGKTDQAKVYYIKALNIDPKQPAVYNYIGNGFLEMGQYQEAVKYFKQALLFNLDYLPSKEGLEKAQEYLFQQERSVQPIPYSMEGDGSKDV